MRHDIRLEYANVLLRPICDADIEELRVWRNAPINCNFLKKIGTISAEQQKQWFENYLLDNNQIVFAIEENSVLNRIVGSLALYDFSNGKAEFGKIMVGDSRAHGLHVGTNATIAALYIGFNKLGLSEIYLHVSPENYKALACFTKAGFSMTDETTYSSGWLEYLMTIDGNKFKGIGQDDLLEGN